MNVIAIDDEPIALQIIKEFAKKIPFINMKGTFTNPLEALQFITNEKIDLIFLDINMPDISGIELTQSLSKPISIVFTTAYSEYAVQSFDLDAVDYLLKPFSFARFLKACNKVQHILALQNSVKDTQEEDFLFIKDGYENVKVNYKDILYLQSFGNYCKIYLSDGQVYVSRITLMEMEDNLPLDFIRSHRMYIVNKKAITKYTRSNLFINDIEIPIGPSFKNMTEELF